MRQSTIVINWIKERCEIMWVFFPWIILGLVLYDIMMLNIVVHRIMND